MSKFLIILISLPVLLSGCSSTPIATRDMDNICYIFEREPDWKEASQDSFKNWGTPPWTQLAIVHQESKFKPDARPPKDYFLWFIPWGHVSSAKGYSQALDGTWKEYKQATGNWGADRDDIEDSLDFIGWYNHKSNKMAGISKRNAYQLYLAYHEGQGGYKRGTYRNKAWLKRVARKVQQRAVKYMKQYRNCN